MADVFTPEKRSEVMSRIRSTGTKPEERLKRLVKATVGARRVRSNHRRLPGSPDVVIPSLKLAIFMDGCFFHGCPWHARIPASNRKYWQDKIERNIQRDERNRRQLRREGYHVWRIWEHGLEGRRLAMTAAQLRRRLESLNQQVKGESL